MSSPDIVFDLVSADDLDVAIEIEKNGYPADEAASLDAFRLRQSQAGDLFLGAYTRTTESKRQLIGYICSTRALGETLTHESMSTHKPSGPSVCIHSVCVSDKHRRQGVALRLLGEYIFRLKNAFDSEIQRALLLAHEELIPLYQKAGFELVGKSSVTHGARPWYEMRFELHSNPETTTTSEVQVPAGVWEALQASSASRSGPAPKTLSSYDNGIDDLVVVSGSSKSNKSRILCPRCSSIILLENVATLVEGPSIQIDPPNVSSAHPLLPALPEPHENTHWWLVTPSPMKFENIGFSRPVESIAASATGKKLKLLACAECDLGPVGWSEEGGTEFWLAVSRVGYRG